MPHIAMIQVLSILMGIRAVLAQNATSTLSPVPDGGEDVDATSPPSPAPLPQAPCCASCAGRPFCSPVSGNCYYARAKDYYEGCARGNEPAPSPAPSCCAACAGRPFCSPNSGNCYLVRAKGYYEDCTSGNQSAPSPAPAPACCAGCAGSAFCSPNSGNCYASRAKDYYEACADGGDGGLAPPPPPPSGGLVPPPPPPSGAGRWCCDACSQDQFCSPASGNCYASKAKSYYTSCEPLVVGDLVWVEEFDRDGAVDEAKWRYLNGPNPSNSELQYYTGRPNNSIVDGGVLKITAQCEDYEGFEYTSARLITKNLGDWGPGHRIESRVKLPTGVGTWPAVWMLPTDSDVWPGGGEIDIMEAVGCTARRVYGTVHTDAFNHMINTQVGTSYKCDVDEWHTYTIDWEESRIRWFVDGKLYHTFAPDTSRQAEWPFAERFYLILNLAVGGSWGGFCLDRGPSCSSPEEFGAKQVMEVDYVRIYELLRASNVSTPVLFP
eukprot:TRINITY_DN13127_c0_g1_i1.p1 TRINITY_DN13127_c0_g1~~TRINITY_DN13127_c0_g1_i1.p1  ORF type:complete len:511 (-),score=80.22 TRINITY_DN13127_c0_g1_i1:106-1584(-)